MYDDLLIPTDGSENALPAIENGVTMADQFEATVHALSVAPYVVTRDRIRYDPEERANRAVAEVEQQCQEHDVDVTTAVRRGDPAEEILAYIDEGTVDAVIMGTHGRSGVGNVFFGNVADRVVKNAAVPVTTVRPTD